MSNQAFLTTLRAVTGNPKYGNRLSNKNASGTTAGIRTEHFLPTPLETTYLHGIQTRERNTIITSHANGNRIKRLPLVDPWLCSATLHSGLCKRDKAKMVLQELLRVFSLDSKSIVPPLCLLRSREIEPRCCHWT
jgi:hypothetical protein